MGLSPFISSEGHRYYFVFVDVYSNFVWEFPMFKKSDVSHIFLQIKGLVENQFNITIKSIQTDGDGEFRVLTHVLNKQGILHWLSCSHTHEL